MGGMFRALRYRNYRLFFIGQTLSLIGTWMEGLAMSWLVYRITGSAAWLGTVSFAGQIPMFLASPYAGVMVERLDKRKLLLWTQVLFALTAGALAVLTLGGWIHPWHLVVLGIVNGTISAFDMPARQALVVRLVDNREDLANAIALNSTQFNLARLIGPPLAGIAIGVVGEGGCFAINTASFLAVIVSIAMMQIVPDAPLDGKSHWWHQLKEGASYAWGNLPIRAMLLLMAAVSFISGAYMVLVTVYAKTVYGGNELTLSFLTDAVAVGALTSALSLARRKSVRGLLSWISRSSGLMLLGVILFGLTRSVWEGLPALALVGFGAMMHMGATNTLIQTIAEDRVRGRIMSLYAMSFVGTMPIGSLVAGWLTPHIGPMWVLVGGGAIGLISVLVFYRSLSGIRDVLRPVYQAKGIIEPAAGA